MVEDRNLQEWPEGPGDWSEVDDWSDVLENHMVDFVDSNCGARSPDIDAAFEVVRLYSVAEDTEIDPLSPIGAFFTAATKAGMEAAVKNISEAMGVTRKEIWKMADPEIWDKMEYIEKNFDSHGNKIPG